MQTILIVITALSLAVAAGLAIVVARLLREDRERSDARVAALALIAADPLDAEVGAPHTGAAHAFGDYTHAGNFTTAVEPAPDFDLRPDARDVAPALFSERNPVSPWGRRFAVMGTLAAVLAAVLLAATFGGRHADVVPAPNRVAADAAPAGIPLELLELRHVRDAETLTISGVVRNPKGAAPVERLVATAFVFGPEGSFLTSSRAPIGLTTLAPGDESPFVVAIPVHGQVSRYRIGFRREDGRVVAHVDNRTTETFARKQDQP
ncbi:MAG: hypothetical protein V7647_597 [Acidobacteriota bacterium]|jgi:hypothetical protein